MIKTIPFYTNCDINNFEKEFININEQIEQAMILIEFGADIELYSTNLRNVIGMVKSLDISSFEATITIINSHDILLEIDDLVLYIHCDINRVGIYRCVLTFYDTLDTKITRNTKLIQIKNINYMK